MLLGQGTLVGDATPEMIQAAIAQVAGEEVDAVINLAVGAAAGGAPFAVSADVIMSSTNATEARAPPPPLPCSPHHRSLLFSAVRLLAAL